MLKSEIGNNAGQLWEVLNSEGEMSLKNLKTATGLTEKALCMAIGWLAREGKLYLHEKQKDVIACLVH